MFIFQLHKLELEMNRYIFRGWGGGHLIFVVAFASYLIAGQLLKEEFVPLEACALRMDHVRRAMLAQEVTRKIHFGKTFGNSDAH